MRSCLEPTVEGSQVGLECLVVHVLKGVAIFIGHLRRAIVLGEELSSEEFDHLHTTFFENVLLSHCYLVQDLRDMM